MIIIPVILLCSVAVLALAIAIKLSASDHRKRAWKDYQSALHQLRRNPTDPGLRGVALQRGRYYSTLTRNNRNVAIFDEIAIKNDLDAACAGALRSAIPVAQAVPNQDATTVALQQRIDQLNQRLNQEIRRNESGRTTVSHH